MNNINKTNSKLLRTAYILSIVTEGETAFIFLQTEAEEEHGHEEGVGENEESHAHDEGEGEEAHEHGGTEDTHGHEDGGEKLTFRKVRVVPGIHDAGYVEIKLFEPLGENTLIALVGAYILSSEMIKGELEHEH